MVELRESIGAAVDVAGEGNGWIAWHHLGDMHVTILSDDNATKGITIRDDNVIDDMLASARWVATLSDAERDRALAAVECLENG